LLRESNPQVLKDDLQRLFRVRRDKAPQDILAAINRSAKVNGPGDLIRCAGCGEILYDVSSPETLAEHGPHRERASEQRRFRCS